MSSARDRLEAVLSRLAERAAGEKVFTKLYPDVARAAADVADARRKAGIRLGPLDGEIVSIKDLLDVGGEPTLAGSLLRRTAPPAQQDAPVVQRLRRAGAVIVGKTNMTEFAFTSLGLNPHYGTPGNSADAGRIPGGSSSGAGVSVAEGTSTVAIGSDTGGSIRIPAALNGVVGFKPTARRVPLDGAFPLSFALDSLGPLARTVAECAATDAVLAGEEPLPLLPARLDGLRVGIPRGYLFSDTEEPIVRAFENAIRELERSGARLFDIAIDDLVDAMNEATQYGSIAGMEGAAIHADWLEAGTDVPVDPHVSVPLARYAKAPVPIYIRTMRSRAGHIVEMDRRLVDFDVLALPTVPIMAPLIEAAMADPKFADRMEGLLLRNTEVFNYFDQCAISLPMPGTVLPSGLMLVGRHGDDRRLLAIAAAVEALLKA
ncbi:amidase [Mesorhizobium sp. NPDC059025]|uniref:amidase n=1 Tax=unclassified Mesorhizobium TaxID=325217 RepID=UPI0036A4F4D4